jgi:steroid delta-isomerase-like uncharacterized protein
MGGSRGGTTDDIHFTFLKEVHMLRRTAILFAVIFLIGFIGCQTPREKDLQSERMMREYLETWNTHDLGKMVSFFTDDCVYENLARGQTYRGKDELNAWAKGAFDAIPDFKLDITSLFVSGDWTACEWVMTGTQSGDLPGLPATGKSFSVRGGTIVQLKDRKILRNADYWDLATFLRQLGVMK